MSHTYTTALEWEPSEGGWGSARVFATVGGLEVELESTHHEYDWLVDCAMQDAWRQSE